MKTVVYSNIQDAIQWSGIQLAEGPEFNAFMIDKVASRLHDHSGKADFSLHLKSLASTGFEQENLKAILEAEYPEERDWAVGEALAEAWLSHDQGVIWPWNMLRDKRTPQASLPGADLVGFKIQDGKARLLLGEVKSSSDGNIPPQVMTGRNGMARQLESLATDFGLLFTVIRWLQPRCRNNDAEPHFNEAIRLLLQSNYKAMVLFGVLVRDTQPNEGDLRKRGQHLGGIIQEPASCHLLPFIFLVQFQVF